MNKQLSEQKNVVQRRNLHKDCLLQKHFNLGVLPCRSHNVIAYFYFHIKTPTFSTKKFKKNISIHA